MSVIEQFGTEKGLRILNEAADLSEAKLSVLRELADSLGVSLGELLKALALVIPAFGGPDVDEPPNFTDHEVKIEPGTCPADGDSVQDTRDLEDAVGGQDLAVKQPPEDLKDDKAWDGYLEWLYSAIRDLDCETLTGYAHTQSELVNKSYGLVRYRAQQILEVVLEVMEENGCIH